MIPLLQRLQGWRLSMLLTIGIVICTLLIVSVMDLLLNGEVTADYLLTGLVAAALVAPPSMALLSHFLKALARQQRESLSNSVLRAESRLKTALEAIDQGILMVAQGGEVLLNNTRFLELLRVPRALANTGRNEPILSYVADQLIDPEAFLTQVRRLYDNDEEASDTLKFKDGRVLERYSRPLSIGCTQGRLWCFKDITERSQLIDALRQRAHYQRALLDNFPFMVWLKDEQSRFLAVNQAFATGAGCPSAQSLIGKTDLDIWPPDLAATYRADDRAVLEGGQPKHVEEPIEIDGHRVWFETYKSPVSIAGRVIGTVGFARDITARKLAEHRLEMAEEATRLIFWELDLSNGQLRFDHTQLPRLGLEADAGLDSLHGWMERVHPDDREPFAARVEQAMQPGDSIFDCEYRMSNQTDQDQWIHTRGRVIQRAANGRALLAVGTSMNINARKQTEEAMRASEERSSKLASMLRLMCDNVPDMIWAKDLEKRYLFANQAMCQQLLMATDTDEPVGKTDVFFAQRERANHPENPEWHTFGELCQDSDTITLSRGRASIFEESGNVKGAFLCLDVHKAPFLDEHGAVIGTVGSARDFTERKQAEEKLHLAASVFTHASEGIMITTADGTIVEVNDAFSLITGYRRDEVLGRNPRLLSSGRQDAAFYATLWRTLIDQGHWSGELWNRRKGGGVFATMQTISAVRDALGRISHYVALFSDISPLKEHQRRLEHIAHYDALTTLPNRVLLADRLRQAMAQTQRRGQQLAVAYLDLDGFKSINDNHGHDAGDQLLMALAERMKGVLREGDTLARLGGDEFVAVLVDLTGTESCVPTLTRLLAAAAAPVQVADLTHRVSASLGVTLYPQTEEVDADQLLRQSDQAMYQAKLTGKNRYHFFDAELDRCSRSHHESRENIRNALALGEFVLYYQPKVNMRTGAIIGVEALIRWRHPERGLLLPGVFLPVIEGHPLAIDVGDWVIESALVQIEGWQAEGLDISVCVNVGASQLQQTDFVEHLIARLKAHPNILPGRLGLEVLETSALEDLARVSQVIEDCRKYGVMFALDDFGTGYSSLTYLKRLPITLLKIDLTFVTQMLDDPENLTIVESVVGLAAAFRRQVVAEGVETLEHGEMLLRLGCDLAQGFGISHPMPAHEIPVWLATWHPPAHWADLPAMSRDDLPLLFAGVEHRAWIANIEQHLRNDFESPLTPEHPPIDFVQDNQCRFGVWLQAEGLKRHGSRPAFQALVALHQEVHGLALELLELQAEGRNRDALGRLGELHALRDALLERMKEIAS